MKSLHFLLLSLFLSACHTSNDHHFVIKGHIDGRDTGYVWFVKAGQEQHIDSVRLLQGRFQYEGHVNEPTAYMIHFGLDQQPGFAMIEPGTTQIQYTFNRSNSLQIQGGNEQHLYNQFLQACQPVFNSIDSLGRVANDHLNEPDVLNSLERQYGHFDTLMKQLQTDFIHAHPDLYSGAFVAVNYVSGLENRSIEHIQPLYDALQDKIKNSYFGRKLKSVLDVLRQTAVGQPAPDFTTPDISNKPVALSSLKGHIVLLDFWASWCLPCRQENPNVVMAYQRYHEKGLEILGVSLDTQAEAWQAAIRKDALNWLQVCDFNGWDGKVPAMYGVQSIPANYLIDSKGNILAKNLKGEALLNKLDSLFSH